MKISSEALEVGVTLQKIWLAMLYKIKERKPTK